VSLKVGTLARIAVEILFIVEKKPFDCAQGDNNKKIGTYSRISF
jgi:hypothetical protein